MKDIKNSFTLTLTGLFRASHLLPMKYFSRLGLESSDKFQITGTMKNSWHGPYGFPITSQLIISENQKTNKLRIFPKRPIFSLLKNCIRKKILTGRSLRKLSKSAWGNSLMNSVKFFFFARKISVSKIFQTFRNAPSTLLWAECSMPFVICNYAFQNGNPGDERT